MSIFTFTKATKKAAKGRIALDGPSGSGKTMTALIVAATLGEKVALIDTEHGSASKYADLFEFDTLHLDRYSPQILIDALAAATAAGYDVVIVDSLSHFWMGTDGMLEQVDKAAKRSGGHGMSGWKEMRPVERQMVEALLAYPGHIICTLRVKTDWVEGENARGKRQMMKVGTKAEQREGLEYEFDLVASMDLSNELTVVKSRCPALSGEIVTKPGREFAEVFKTWLDDGEQAGPSKRDQLLEQIRAAADKDQLVAAWSAIGAALKANQVTQTDVDALLVPTWQAQKASVVVEPPAEPKNPGNDPARRKMMALFTEAEYTDRDDRLDFVAKAIGRKVETTNDLTDAEVSTVIERLERYIDAAPQENELAGAGAR
ncbi:ATP-binding protein [Actinoplanes sp. NPDC048796]|uniref:ATP-binding protein n=1 Tax=Actinoplanes sp. NPDC048796 TaxID=3155640 RepID=UPI0033F74D02